MLPLKLDHQINYHSSLLPKYEWQWMTTGKANFQLGFVIGNGNFFVLFYRCLVEWQFDQTLPPAVCSCILRVPRWKASPLLHQRQNKKKKKKKIRHRELFSPSKFSFLLIFYYNHCCRWKKGKAQWQTVSIPRCSQFQGAIIFSAVASFHTRAPVPAGVSTALWQRWKINYCMKRLVFNIGQCKQT